MKLTEKQIQRQITDYIDKILIGVHKIDIKWYHTYDSRRSKKGFPDLWIGVKRFKSNSRFPVRHYFIEIKSEKGRATPEQQEFINWIYDDYDVTHGYIVRSLNEFIEKTNNFVVKSFKSFDDSE